MTESAITTQLLESAGFATVAEIQLAAAEGGVLGAIAGRLGSAILAAQLHESEYWRALADLAATTARAAASLDQGGIDSIAFVEGAARKAEQARLALQADFTAWMPMVSLLNVARGA